MPPLKTMDVSEAPGLRLQLQQEQAARHEYELQTAATTRQLWLLRDKHDREMKQLHDQLSVVRASLILAHKQQHSLQTGTATQQQLRIESSETALSVICDDLPDSPKKGRKLLDQVSRVNPLDSSNPTALAAGASSAAVQHQAVNSSSTPTCQEASAKQAATTVLAAAVKTKAAADAGRTTAVWEDTSTVSNGGLHVTARTAAQLLAVAAKLQQLVEQLTHREPSVAADLSVLQWQLTAAYGSLTGTSNHISNSRGATYDNGNPKSLCSANHGSQAARAERDNSSIAADSAQSAGGFRIATAASMPNNAADLSNSSDSAPPAAAAPAAMSEQYFQDVVAGARLFSGAATSAAATATAQQLVWYYKDGSSIKGPYDPALMMRWHCSCYLEGSLPLAGVAQQADGSSSPPADSAFEPLRAWLDRVQQQQQGLHVTHGGLQQLQSSSTAEARQQGQVVVAPPATAAVTAQPCLPISTHSTAPCDDDTHAAEGSCRVGFSAAAAAAAAAARQQYTDSLMDLGKTHVSEDQQSLQYACAGELQQYTYETAVQQQQQHHQQQEHLLIRVKAASADASEVKEKQRQQQLEDEQQEVWDSAFGQGWSIAAVSKAAYAAYDVLEGMGTAVESAVTATVEHIILKAETALAGQMGEGEGKRNGLEAESSNGALEFVSDVPQLIPTAVMENK